MVIAGSAGEGASVKFWTVASRAYDGIFVNLVGENLRAWALEKLGSEDSLGRAVEIGCGTGYFTKALASVADSVVATDFCDGMLAKARERLKDLRNVTIQKEDCLKTSFPDDTFDTVFMALVLNHVADPEAALKEAYRILKPGGRLIIVNPDNSMANEIRQKFGSYIYQSSYGDAQAKYPQVFRDLSGDELGGMLESSGFKVDVSDMCQDGRGAFDAMEYISAIKVVDAFNIVMSVAKSHGLHGKPEDVIEVKYLVKKFDNVTAVRGVSFTVRKGEVFALLGPNGAGKTTIVEILELLKTPTRGFVSIFGDAVLTGIMMENPWNAWERNYAAVKERIGVLPQGFNSFDLLTVHETVDYFAGMYAKHADVDGLIGELGLGEKRDVLFKDLSRGLKQRVGIAIALVNDPEIIFLDEPTTGLDPRSRRDVWESIKALKARGKTIVLTTHYMDEAYRLADRVCIIHKGGIVAEGTPEGLINRYGGGNTLVIRECSAADEVVKAIPGSHAEGNSVLAKLPEGDGMAGGGIASIADAIEAIEAGGFGCREIYVKKPTLEDVFLNLTGEKLTEGGQ